LFTVRARTKQRARRSRINCFVPAWTPYIRWKAAWWRGENVAIQSNRWT